MRTIKGNSPAYYHSATYAGAPRQDASWRATVGVVAAGKATYTAPARLIVALSRLFQGTYADN